MEPGRTPVTTRLIPRWWIASTIVLLLACLGVGVIALLAADGLARVVYMGIGVAALLLLVAAVRSFLLPRRRRVLPIDADGATVIESPALIVWPVVLSWLVLFVSAVGLPVLLVVDPDAVEAPGAAVATGIGAVMAVPDTFRLLTGRLHRWRLTLGPDGYTYRGYRTDETVPWSKVHGASIRRGKDAGVVIDRKGTGPDLVVPITAFDVPAEQIVEEVQARIGARRR